ncbi:hypothetical protein VE04_08206 [Pseudogymnoascus sp. 24MN13]|nr:hypothetical protein VE04_08206 [Pseudogymnoascus sp. 24MN13]
MVDDMSLDPFWDLSMALIDWMCTFGDNNLQSLSLNLGCCVPNEILNYPENYWTKKQKRIQSISLLTDGESPTFAYVYLDLKSYTSIQSLSWKGLSRGDHFDCLEDFIKNQTGARGLRTLTLDLVEWNRSEKGWYDHQKATLGGFLPRPDNFFATRVVGIESDQNKVLFQSLKTLLLVGAVFAPFEYEFDHSFNMMSLSTVQLRNCPSSLELLGALLEQGITPN